MTALELLNDTVQYYSEDTKRRSVMRKVLTSNWAEHKTGDVINTCEYYQNMTGEVKMCAIGRYMIDPKAYITCTESIRGLLDLDITSKSTMLKPEVVLISTDNLQSIQSLHDCDWYWDENGLTEDGLENVKSLRRQFSKLL